jgi:predicted homoserine dehydrogenase-like protein
VAVGALPIGLAHGVPVIADIAKGDVVRMADVKLDETSEPMRLRREAEGLLEERALLAGAA